jgi:hypothetical protein
MYLQKEFILATPVMLYACLRFRSFIDHRILKNVSVFVFLCLAAGYPVAESLSHGPGKGWTEIVMLAGYYALPLLLYLVMAVALADLHLRASTPGRVLESLVRKVNAQKADIVLVGGDILEGDRRDEDFCLATADRNRRRIQQSRPDSTVGVSAIP